MTPPDPREALAEVLAAHPTWYTSNENRLGTTRRWFCGCGEQIDDDHSGVNIAIRHRAHVADHLARLLATREAEALERAADAWPFEVNMETLKREMAITSLRDVPEPYTVADWLRARAQEVRGG